MNKLLSVIVCTSLLGPLVAVAQSPKPIVPSTPLHQGLEARQRSRSLEAECNVMNASQVLKDIYDSEIRSNPLLGQVFADANSAPVKAAINDCRSGREGGGRAGMDRWIRQTQNRQWYWQNLVSPALAQLQQPAQAQKQDLRSQCNAQVASEVLRDIFAPEIRNHPVLAQVFADANSAPVKGAVNDCSVGREGGGRAGMDRWIRQAQNRQWYWQNLVSPTLAQDLRSQCNAQVASEVLRDIFAPEIRNHPVLAQVFADANSAPVKGAVNDCSVGREGGGRAGMDRWIRQAQNRQWYWQNLVSPTLAQDLRSQCNAQVASEVLRDIFAPEIRNHPVLAQVFADANSAPVKGAVNDCSVGREGGGRAGMDRWIRQAQNRQWYWQNLVSPTLAAAQAGATPPPTPPRFYQGESQQAKAPARCERSQVQLDPAKIDNRERCFGAIGSGCKDQADGKFTWKKWPTPEVNDDCTIKVKVSVGSILHDSCCRTLWDQGRPGDGHFCKPAPGDASIWMGVDALAGYPAGWDNKVCAREWRKAVFDTAQDRVWTETFGPYSSNDQQDNLSPVGNSRPSLLPGRLGVNDDLRRSSTVERAETRRLSAPSGTKLEIHDKAFCKSGRFKQEGWCNASAITAIQVLAFPPAALFAQPGCSNTSELQGSQRSVADWEAWRDKRRAEMNRVEAEKQAYIDAWHQWAQAKYREAYQYWPVDPRRVAIEAEVAAARVDELARNTALQTARAAHAAEMAAAEVDHQRRKLVVWAIETKRTNASEHYGVCE